jgi:hypothetical protein
LATLPNPAPLAEPPVDLDEHEPPVKFLPFHAPLLTNLDSVAIPDFNLRGF